MPITAEQQVKQYRIDRTKGRGGSLAITDENGHVESVIVTEEAMANQSRQLLTPIVDGLIYPGSVGLVAAPPKAGKSNLAFMLSHELATGRDYLGYRVKEKCCVLLAEFEEGDSVMAARYQRFPDDDAFFENGELGIQYTPAPFEFVEDAAGAITVDKSKGLGRQIYLWHNQICQGLFPGRAGVVFIDTMARALPVMGGGKYTSDLNYIGAVHALAEELGIAIVFIHHTNKAEHADSADAISGTNGVAGSCDWMMVVYRDNDPETKQRLSTGRLVCNSRYMSEDELLRWVKLSDHGFWELDFERESAEEMKRRVAREKEVPRCVRKIRTLMNKNDKWAGTATDLAKALNDGTAPQALTRKLNASQEWLAEQGIHYWNDRINKRRLLHFEVVAAPTEQVEIIEDEPAEVDFSDSIPNPYIGKVRHEVMEPDGQEPAAEDYIPAEFEGIENEPFPEWYNPADRTVVMNITARVGEAEADEYIDAVRVLRDTCATLDEKVQARILIARISKLMGEAGMEVPTQADAVAGNWPKSLIGHIVNGEEA